jgi:hypothetical protein
VDSPAFSPDKTRFARDSHLTLTITPAQIIHVAHKGETVFSIFFLYSAGITG